MQQTVTNIEPVPLSEVPRQLSLDTVHESEGNSIADRIEAVTVVAATWADDVDRKARFPEETFETIRTERLLGIMLPANLGGEDVSLSSILNICYRLGKVCASTGMIYAMHQSCMACILRHRGSSSWHRDFLSRVASDQLLLASSTTEGQGGGNVRSSAAPVEQTASGIRLDRAATVVSYGDRADAIITTARRSAASLPSNQVLVSFLKDDYVLEQTVQWNALGMRGTCSSGFNMKAVGRVEQIVPAPYERIHPQTMVPVSHLAWSATWAGIAAGAAERARAFIRRAARHNDGALPPGAAHLTKALSTLQNLRSLIVSSLRAYEQQANDPDALMSLEFQMQMNFLKVEASEAAVAIVLAAGRACGLAGYRNDSEFSIGRHLRDILSAPIMISNDRILANAASPALLMAPPTRLCE